MNRKTFTLIILLFFVLSVTTSCDSSSGDSGSRGGEPASWNKVGYRVPIISEIIFAGKVVNPDSGEWPNNRLVLLFLNSKEIARTVTSTMRYDGMVADSNPPTLVSTLSPGEIASGCTQGTLPASYCGKYTTRLDNGLGIADGEFVLRVPNTYQLTRDIPRDSPNKSPFVQIQEKVGVDEVLGVWIDPFNEDTSRDFYIPSKNIKYIVMVLPGDFSQLPAVIQKPSSLKLLEGNRLVAVDPIAPTSAPQSPSYEITKFDQVVETSKDFSPSIFPINNCRGAADIKQEISQTYIHEIIDESKIQLGVSISILDWLRIVPSIEKHYGISDKQITTYSTTLTVPAGKNIQYKVLHKQIWESGTAVVVSNGKQISAPYRIQKSEVFEVANPEQKTCP